jgi:hypothetical protein
MLRRGLGGFGRDCPLTMEEGILWLIIPSSQPWSSSFESHCGWISRRAHVIDWSEYTALLGLTEIASTKAFSSPEKITGDSLPLRTQIVTKGNITHTHTQTKSRNFIQSVIHVSGPPLILHQCPSNSNHSLSPSPRSSPSHLSRPLNNALHTMFCTYRSPSLLPS